MSGINEKIDAKRSGGDPGAALLAFKQEAMSLRRAVKQLRAELDQERAGRHRDTKILFGTLQTFADARGPALAKAGAPSVEQIAQAIHGGSFEEFAQWWIDRAQYVDAVGK